MKIIACIGFMILGIIIDCGGVPTDNRGHIGAKYWYEYDFLKFPTHTDRTDWC
jgi:amino acid permease